MWTTTKACDSSNNRLGKVSYFSNILYSFIHSCFPLSLSVPGTFLMNLSRHLTWWTRHWAAMFQMEARSSSKTEQASCSGDCNQNKISDYKKNRRRRIFLGRFDILKKFNFLVYHYFEISLNTTLQRYVIPSQWTINQYSISSRSRLITKHFKFVVYQFTRITWHGSRELVHSRWLIWIINQRSCLCRTIIAPGHNKSFIDNS